MCVEYMGHTKSRWHYLQWKKKGDEQQPFENVINVLCIKQNCSSFQHQPCMSLFFLSFSWSTKNIHSQFHQAWKFNFHFLPKLLCKVTHCGGSAPGFACWSLLIGFDPVQIHSCTITESLHMLLISIDVPPSKNMSSVHGCQGERLPTWLATLLQALHV